MPAGDPAGFFTRWPSAGVRPEPAYLHADLRAPMRQATELIAFERRDLGIFARHDTGRARVVIDRAFAAEHAASPR